MLIWDKTDVLSVLEVIPETEKDEVWHKYSIKKDGLELRITVHQYDGDINIQLNRDGVESPVFSMLITDCPSIVRKVDSRGEYLEFGASKCFGSRYDGETPIPYGVRISIYPSINITLF